MYSFGPASMEVYKQLHPGLQRYCDRVIKIKDVSLICGYRGRAEQELAFKSGNSKAHFGESPHNYWPALAVDLVPWPTQFESKAELHVLNGITIAIASVDEFPITCGNDWDHDGDVDDETFHDSPHVQLIDWKKLITNTCI